MKKLELVQLIITNFQNHKNLTIDFNGNKSFKGVNAVGKTTIFSALSWLRNGCDVNGNSKFDIKPNNVKGTHLKPTTVTVEALYSLDGEDLRIKRVLREDWTQKRGQKKRFLTGHTTDYYINDMHKTLKQKDFDAEMIKIATPEQFKQLTDPLYVLGRMETKKRRNLIIETAGASIADKDVDPANNDYKAMFEEMKDRTPKEHEDILKGDQTKIKKRLGVLDSLIEENKELIAKRKLPEQSKEQLEIALDKNRGILAGNQKKHSRLLDGDGLEAAENEFAAILNKHTAEINSLTEERRVLAIKKQNIATKKQKEIDAISKTLGQLNESIEKDTAYKKAQEAEKTELGVSWLKADRTVIGIVKRSECDKCGTVFLPEKIEEMENIIKADFAKEKADSLKLIDDEAKEINIRIGDAVAAISVNLGLIKARNIELEGEGLELKILNRDTEDTKTKELSSSKLEAINKEKTEKEEEINRIKSGKNTLGIVSVNEAIEANNEKIKSINAKIAAIDSSQDNHDQIKKHENEIKEKSKLFDKIEEKINTLEQFDLAKCGKIEKIVNKIFHPVRFELFEHHIGGGHSSRCNAFVGEGQVNRGLNTGHFNFAGMKIIEKLQEFYGIILPVYIDNAESITLDIETKGQLLKTYVPDIKSLEQLCADMEEEDEPDLKTIARVREDIRFYNDGNMLIEDV